MSELVWLSEIERGIEAHSLGPEDHWCYVTKTDQRRLCHAVRELHARLRALRVASESVLMAHDEAAASENPRIIQEALQALKTQVVAATMTEARWS